MINKIFIRIPGSYDINFAIIFIQFLNLAPFPHFHRIAISHMASAAVGTFCNSNKRCVIWVIIIDCPYAEMQNL